MDVLMYVPQKRQEQKITRMKRKTRISQGTDRVSINI